MFRPYFIISLLLFSALSMLHGQAPIIVSDTEGNISEINLPINCNKRIIKNVGRSLSDITLHPNGKMYGCSFSREELYEVDTTDQTSGTASLKKIIDFPGIKMVGMTASNNGKIYISEGGKPSRLFEVDVTTNTFITKGTLANGSAGDLTWYQGELYNASEDNKLVKINIDNPENSIVIGNFNNSDLIFSLATNAFSCDSSVTYGITEDRAYFKIDMNTGALTFICSGSGPRVFGSTSSDEFIASETCKVIVDLDENNSSGAFGNDYQTDFDCLEAKVLIADEDVQVDSDNGVDSIIIELSSGILDGNSEFLSTTGAPNVTSNNNAQRIVAVSNGSATNSNFSDFLKTIYYNNTAAPASLGLRTIEVVAYGDNEISPTATSRISINSDVNAGDDGNATFCSTDSPADLRDFLGGSPQNNGFWKPELSGGNNEFNPAIDKTGIYTYFVSDGCYDDSSTVNVTVDDGADAGENGTLVLCETGPMADLFEALNGSPDFGGSWSPALNSGTGIFEPGIDPPGIYVYSVVACNNPSASVEVTLTDVPDAGRDTTVNICLNSEPKDLFNLLGGNPDVGGNWTPMLSGGNGIFNPNVDPSGSYNYTVFGCDTISSEIFVAIDSPSTAGEGGNISICMMDNPFNLFELLDGSPDPGGNWIPSLSGGGDIFNPSIDTSGTYTYLVTGPPSCGDASAQIVVEVEICNISIDLDADNSSGVIGTDYATNFLCQQLHVNISDTDVNLISSAAIDSIVVQLIEGNIDGAKEYLVVTQDPDFQTTDSTQKIVIYISPFINTISEIEDFISGILYVNEGNAPTSGDRIVAITVYANDKSAVALSTISLLINEAYAGENGAIEVNLDDPIFNLFDELGGSPQASGVWLPPLSGNGNFFNPAVDPPGEYIYVVTNECDIDSAIMTVVILDVSEDSCNLNSLFIPNAFTPNGDERNDVLFVNILGDYDLLDFRVYNRWGELVFETNDINQGWDGSYKDELQTTDVFGYYIQVECRGQIVQRKGNITLIR